MVMRAFWNMNLTVLFSLFVCAFAVADWQRLQTYQLKIGCLTWLQLLWLLQLHCLLLLIYWLSAAAAASSS